MKLKRDSLSAAFASDLNKKIREQMLRGEKPSQCSSCYKSEESSNTSPRINFNNQYSYLWHLVEENKPSVRYLDLRLGNKCNLRCVMCDAQNSSQIMKDCNDLDLINDMQWTEDKSYHQKIEQCLETLEEIYFTGGEPLLIEDHYQILKLIIDRGYAHKVAIKYTTNGTVFSEKIPPLWNEFRQVSVGLSIDGIGALDEKIRVGSKWSVIEKNMDRFFEHADQVMVQTCVMTKNVANLIEIIEYCYSKPFVSRFPFLNILNFPTHLALKNASEKENLASNLLTWHEMNQDRYNSFERPFVDRILLVAAILKA